MRHPAGHMRKAQKSSGGDPDYHRVKGVMKQQQTKNSRKLGKKKDHGHKNSSLPLRFDKGGSSNTNC